MKFGRVFFSIFLLAVIFWLYKINRWQIGLPFMSNRSIDLIASDGKKIAADFYNADNPKGWLIFVHSMPETKESWKDLAEELRSLGYAGVAIDLRGHGDSTTQTNADGTRTDAEIKLGYQNFSDEEHQAGIGDIEAAWEFLKSSGAVPEKTNLIGASIGANLSLKFLTEHSDIGGAALLSAGNYKGMDSELLVSKLGPDQKILLVASKLDERSAGNNASDNQRYYDLASQVKNRHLILFDGAGHGTDLLKLEEEYNLKESIIKFLENGGIN